VFLFPDRQPVSADDNDKYAGVLHALHDLHVSWQAYQAQLSTEIAEYKKTVNAAISILGNEAIKFQKDTTDRLEADAAQRQQRQTRSDRKDIALLSGVGCLIVLNVLAIVILAAVLIIQNWR
jgi:hypothetical protein